MENQADQDYLESKELQVAMDHLVNQDNLEKRDPQDSKEIKDHQD